MEIEQRVHALEQWRSQQTTAQAVNDERRKHMDERFDRLDKGVSEQGENLKELRNQMQADSKKFLWLIIALVSSAVAQFIFQGGLTIGS